MTLDTDSITLRAVRAPRDRVILAPLGGQTKSEGGLHLGRTIESPLGVVVSVGEDAITDVTPGDLVMWLRNLGTQYEWSDGERTVWLATVSPDEIHLIVDEGYMTLTRSSDPKTMPTISSPAPREAPPSHLAASLTR